MWSCLYKEREWMSEREREREWEIMRDGIIQNSLKGVTE